MIDLSLLRPYRNDDLPRVLHFLGECSLHADFCSVLHPGDFVHHLSNGLRGGDPSDSVFVWADNNGQIRALVLLSVYKTTGVYDLVIHPSDQTPDLAQSGIALCEQALQVFAAAKGAVINELSSAVLDCDAAQRELLLQLCYAPEDHAAMIHNLCTLPESIPASTMPDGFTIRNADGEQEADLLGMVHSGAFGSNWPPGEYIKVMRTHGFHINRELIVVAPDGRFAAFLIYWIDPISKCGLFEPVGCHSDFRRRGLTKALMFEGMRRMLAQGMTKAQVKTNADNVAALALYHSVGFKRQYEVTNYRKSV